MQLIMGLIQSLRERLESAYGEITISLDAYADFERIEDNAQGDLYLLGFSTHNVLGTEHKNAADMKLCIDAMDILYTRTEIASFVLIAGDRDYIPVIQHLKRKAKVVRVVGFQGATSGDLLTTLGHQYFIDGEQFFSHVPQKAMANAASAVASGPVEVKVQQPVPPPSSVSAAPGLPVRSQQDYSKLALGVVFKFFKGKSEVWMSPYLHKLRAEFPELSEPQRKAILSKLDESGAITIATRSGEVHDYTVFTLNWNHPDVREVAS